MRASKIINPVTFSEKMVSARLHYAWSPNEIAERLEVSVDTIRKLESGDLMPDGSIVGKLAALTGVPSSIWLNNTLGLPDLQPYNQETPPTLVVQDDESSKRYRLKQVIQHFDNGEQRAFAERIGFREDFLSKLLSEKTKEKITSRTLVKISKHTGVSFDWLSMGIGPWMKTGKILPLLDHEGKALKQYLELNNLTLEAVGEAIGKVRSSISYYFQKAKLGDKVWKDLSDSSLKITYNKVMNIQQNHTNDTNNRHSPMYFRNQFSSSVVDGPRTPIRNAEPLPLEEEYIDLPYLPQSARAGLDADRFWQVPLDTIRVRASLIPLGMEKKEWWIISVDGDSMEPQLASGAKVLAYRTERDNFRLIRPQVLAVQYGEEVVIKRIMENNFDEKKGFTLHSDNPPPNPYFVKGDDIKQIWIIVKIYDAPVR